MMMGRTRMALIFRMTSLSTSPSTYFYTSLRSVSGLRLSMNLIGLHRTVGALDAQRAGRQRRPIISRPRM